MSVLAWHFVGNVMRDGRPVPANGVWLEHTGQVDICRSGLHASRDPFDALQYAPGAVLCRVEMDGDIVEQDDKLVARRRRIIARRDTTDGLRYFARMQALSVVHMWDAPDVVLDYLMTGDDAFEAAAWAAARAAADAARDAARAAVWEAAWEAARAAAWEAERAAARAAARREFCSLVAEGFDLNETAVIDQRFA